MADVKTNQSKVYNALKGMGFTGIGANEQEFAAKMGNPKNREKVYKALISKGYKGIGKDQTAFDSLIYQAQETPQATPATPKQEKSWWDGDPSFRQDQQQYTQKVYNPAEDNMGVGVGAAILQPKPVAQPKPATQPAQTQQQVAQAPQQVQNTPKQQKQEPYKPTIQEQMAFGWNMGGVQNTIDNVTSGIDKMQQGAQKASPFGGNVGLGNNKNLRRGNKTFDAEKGAFVDTYLTSDGREFRDVQQANNAQAGLDEITTNVRLKESLKSIGIDPDIDLTDPKNVNHLLGDAYTERDRLNKGMENIHGQWVDADGRVHYGNRENDEAMQDLQAAYRQNERRINALETARDNGGFWGGTADVLTDPSTYSFGLTDLEDAKQMAKIKSKIDSARENGTKPQLSESEKALVRNFMLNQQAEQLNKDNWWYNAGKGFGQTLSFMKDFALTGGGFAGLAKGGLSIGGNVGKKAATKILGDYMTKNLGTKVLGKTMEYIGKGVGLAAGAEAGGFLLNNTAQAASNIADVMNKQTGNLTVGKDGMLDFENSKNLGMAVLQSQIARTGENGSELVGLAFDKMPQILGRVIQKTTVGKTLKKLTENAFWKKGEGMLNYLGISSVWGEGMEEEYNMARTEILNRLTNGEFAPEGSGLFDLEKQLDTWKTVGLTSMVLRVPSMVMTGTATANYYANKYNLNTSDKNLRYTFGDYERYEAVKSMIDGADNQKIAGVLNNLMTNAELSDEEKQAMFLYANDLIKVRGFNIGNVVAAANGYKEPPKVSSYQVKSDGKSFDELDKDGNVIAHHEYETNDEMKVGLYEAQQKRFDENFNSDISILKSRPDDQFVKLTMDYWNNLDMPITYDEFMEILEKPSIERTDEEQQMIAPFADVLHNTVYDNTILHEEQSQQDGEDIAEADSIDIEEGGEQGAIIAQQWQEAQASRNAVFEQNEDLRQEVELMESQGLSHQEIISRLDWARPEQVQAVIDYYNAKAKFEGYVNRKAQKIDEEAANSRQRHTMKGTIDGKADLNNVYTITDGTNHYYLVSGDITTDPATGRITGAASGLIIGMDLDGSFVNISDTSGYSLEPSTMTLDQFEEAERERLGQQITSIIDPNQTIGQQTNQPQPIQAGEQSGEEAGASTGTGANEAPAAPLSSEPQPIGTGVFGKIYNQFKGRVKDAISFLKGKKEGVAKAALNHPDVGDIDLVWGDNNMGLAHILNKHPEVANNLQNIIDGMEVVQQSENRVVLESDTHRAIISKDWNGQPMDNWLLTAYGKKGASGGSIDIGPEPTGGMQNGTAPLQSTLSESKDTNNSDTSQVLNVKVDKNGVKLYEEGTPIDAAIADIQNDGFDVNEVSDASIAEAQQAIDKINGKPTKTRKDLMDRKSAKDVIDYYNNVKARWAEMNAEAQPHPTEQPEPEQPATPSTAGMTVEEQKQQRIAEAKSKYGELFDDDFTKANDVFELVSMWVGRKRNLAWTDVNGKRGLQKELGWTRKIGKKDSDTKYIETLLAKNGEGMGVDEFVHMVWESPENDVNGEKRFNTEEIKEALLELLRGATSKSDVVDYALNSRIVQAEAALQQQQQMQQETATQPQQAEQPDVEIPDGGLPFAPATEEDFTNDVNETQEITNNNVSLQSENNTDNERKEVESHERGSDGINGAHEAATSLLQGINIEPDSERQGSRSKERLLDELEKSARAAGQWIDDDISTIGEYELGVGGENEVYTTEGNDVIKLNNFNFLRDNATNFEDFLNRLESFNELFPDVALRIVGFAKNSKGEVCVVMMQPAVFDNREATEEEIDKALEDRGFYTDITGNWTDGRYEIADLKPNNVLVDKEGNLHFIDVVTFDSTKPGQMMKAKKPATPEQEQPKQEEQDDYLKPRNAEEEDIISGVVGQLQQEIQDTINEQEDAREQLEEAIARESERSSDMFGNDNALNQEGQLFDNSEMPVDQSAEGIERRTTAERERLQDVTNRLNQLQSEQERNSRIRGALDNHRRQTKIDTDNPIEAIEQAAQSFRDDWDYELHHDKETGKAWVTRSKKTTGVPVTDGRWKVEAKSLAELRSILENPANNLAPVLKAVDARIHNAEAGEQLRKEKPKSNNKVFTDEAHEEVLKKLRAKFNNLNAGFDPEIALLMLQDAGYHIEKGARKIAECAKAMIDELGDFVRPYIKSAYNAVRDYPGMEGIAKEMSSFEEVLAFDPLNFDKAEQQTVNVNKKKNNETENVVSSQSETINNNNNEQKDNQPVGGEAAGSNTQTQGGGSRPTTHVGQGTVGQGLQNGGSQQQGSSRVSQVPRGNSGSGGRSDRRLQGLNKNNNHEERGTESAPSTPRMRTQSNIEAIRLMQQIIEEGRPATDEDKKILRKFSGWGGLGVAFEDPTYSEELRSLLGDAAYDQAQMSRNSAYFTPASIIDAMWDIAKALGFKGGNVLEGSAGIGKIIGLMPSELSDSSNIQAVEIDETTGNILKMLYPDAQVDIQGFEDTKIPNGSIDLAITNVPFVTGLRVQDTTGDKDLSKKFHDIHDFCIAKNIRKLREGGIGIFITSNGTLDNSQKLRDWIISEGDADVVGAFRLNNKTFGGTGTTSDIIVVRKRVNGQKSPNAIDVSLPAAVRGVEYDTGETKKVKGQEVPVIKKLSMDYNSYFVEHPEHMGGEMVFNFEIGETYRPTSKTLTPGSVNQDERLNAWVDEMSKKDWSKEASAETSEPEKPQYEKYGEGVKEGSLILDSKGNICIAQYGEAVPLGVNDKKVKGRSKQECLKDYNAIKNALNEVLNYQVEYEDNDGLQPLLDKLNKAYNQFVAKYGHFHNNTAIAFLRNDVDYASVGALETYKEKTDKDGNKTPVYGKADVFSKRVVEKEKEPQPKTIEDGVIASIYKYNGINIPYIAQQLGMTEEEAKEEILDKGLGFENPDTTQVEVNYVYLSGNVREKLEKAKANNVNGKYAKNISALEKIIPADIPAHLIEFNLGSTWIDKELYKEFFKEKTGKNATFNDANGTWFLGYNEDYTPKDAEGAVFSELCDKTILTSQLIEAAMTGRTIKVQKTEKGWDGKTETITDNEATQACAARIDELKQDFKDWARAKIQSDPEMAEKVEKAYNEKFNNYVPMTIPDEFAPSRFGGQVTKLGGKPFELRPHQSKAVIKGITQPVLFAHEVGTGKTFTLITTAMEMRRIGTAKKPMIVVQNATVGQFTESAKMLYPNAKILTMDEKDHSETARKQFYAKIKYNDWDLIIVPQSVLDKIPDSPDRQLAYINEKIQEKERILMLLEEDPNNWAVVNRLRKELDEMYDEEYNLTEASAARSEKKKKRDEKKRAVAKQNAAVRAKEQLDRSVDDVEDFDDMEIDAILVDEAHGYKKLGFGSVMQRVKGVDTGSSKKCASLLLKTRAVLEKSHGKNVVFATGTPVSNTAAEVWTFMRYLMPEETMEEYGIKFFDDFARNFGNVQQMLEFTTSGKFKENNRFAGYVNMPELARILRSVADIVLTKEAGAVQEAIPELEGGKATDIYLPQTKALRAVMKYVRQELERYEHMTGKEKKANSYIPLVMYGIAKAAAVDARLVDSTAADEPQSKTNEAVRQTLRSLEETKEYNGTIAIFADNYQNKQSGFNLYEDIKKKLVAQGVPSEQIAIIRSDMSDKKKLDIFDKVNSGEIRVVMGSTQTLGTGVNIQERLHTLIHMDAPNRPMDYTQRNGRELRQGNLHREWGIPVRILRFGVEDSLDVTAYQRLKTKGAIADSVMNAKKLMDNAMDSRVLEEEEDVFGDTVAQLSGSEYAMLKNQAEKEVRKLEARYKQWEADQIFVHAQMPRLLGQSDASRLRMEKAEKNLATVEKAMKEPLKIEINGQSYDSLEAMTDFFKDYNSKIKAVEDEIRKSGIVQSQERKLTITINGIPFEFKTIITGSRSHEKGKIKFSTMRQTTFNNEDLIGSERNAKGGYIKNGVEEILNDYLSGNDYREIIETEKNSIARNEAQIKMLEERSGKEFTEGEALEKARERLEEYTQKMKEEMEAKEAKYKEMDSEVEASDSVTMSDEDEDSDAPKRMITTHNPMEAISQAADSWRQDNQKKLLQEIKDFVNSIASRFGANGGVPAYVINSRDDLEALKGQVSNDAYKDIEELYNEPDTGSAYLPDSDIVVIFGEHLDDVKEAENGWWHEQSHSYWQRMPEDVRNKYGQACFDWLKNKRPDIYQHIRREYSQDEWLEEACCFLAGITAEKNGTERFLNENFGGNEEICNFANELRNYIKYGRQERNNQLRRNGSRIRRAEVHRRDSQGRKRESEGLRSEEESELQEEVDPIKAIELSAKRWRKERKERAEDIRDVDEYSAKQVYHERIDRMETMFTEAWQDDMVTFKAGQDAIAHDEKIPDSQNAYQAMNLSYGKTFNEQEQFSDLYKKPLLITVNKVLEKMGWRTGDVDRYLFTKHGLERNRELFVRDWLQNQRRITPTYEDLSFEEQDAYDSQAARIEEQFEDGDITEEQKNKKLHEALNNIHQQHLNDIEQKFVETKQEAYVRLMNGEISFDEYLREVDDFIQEKVDGGFNAEEHDYSGFTEMFGDEEGNYDESEIISNLMVDEDVMGEELQKELWSRINDCSQYGLEKYRTSGMVSDETSKRISDMFHWYVPMRGFNEGMAAQDHWQYMTVKDGANRIGGLLKKAKGRKSEAGFPLATLFGMTYKAISDANQNEVKKYFWRLCQAHENDLVVTSDSWIEYEPSTEEWVVSYPPIDSDMTGPMVAAKVKEWQERMRQAEQEGTAKKLKGKASFDYRVDKERQKEHIVEVMLNGERKMMIVTGNPRMAQAINGQLRYEGGKGAVSRALNAMKQFMQSVSTSFNLTFVGRNMSRDWTHFGAILAVREGAGYELAAQKYYWEQLPKMVSLFKKYRSGSLDTNNEIERDFKDFMDNGGVTGFVHMQKVEAIQKEMQKFMEEQKNGKMIRLNNNIWTKILGAIEAMNEAVENNARFATYRASRHYAGRTKARSAYDAKEVTVNFNKKGAGRKTSGFKTEKKSVASAAKLWGESGQILAANKMFFNATIQAICTIFKNTQNKDGSLNWPYINRLALGYALPPFIMAMAMPLINQALMGLVDGGGDGDDPYANLPEWTRRKAICLYMGWVPGCGKQDFLILPIGQELAAFYSLGDMLAGKTYSNELEPIDKDFVDEMLGFFNVFSPVDFDTKITSDDNAAPVSEYVGRVYSVLAPLVAIGENMSWNGRPIFREDKYQNDRFIPEYKMAYNNVNSQFVAISKWLNDVTGGDDVSRGVLQINPATMQYLVEQYTGGPGKLFANTFVSAGKDLKNAITGDEVDFNVRKLEGVRAFWQQGDDRTQFYRAQAKYRKYKEEADEFGYKMKAYSKDAESNPDHLLKLEELSKGEDAARYGIIIGADETLRDLNTAANQATGRDRKNLRSLYNEQLKYVVDELDRVKDIPEDPNQ